MAKADDLKRGLSRRGAEDAYFSDKAPEKAPEKPKRPQKKKVEQDTGEQPSPSEPKTKTGKKEKVSETKIAVPLSWRQKEGLDTLADMWGITNSAVMREALDALLEDNADSIAEYQKFKSKYRRR